MNLYPPMKIARVEQKSLHQLLFEDDDIDLDYTTASFSCDSRSENSIDTEERRKKPPRILKRDIRRNYAFMFVNTLNGYDLSLLQRFLRSHCSRNVTLYQECPGVHYPPYVFLKGCDLITLHWSWKMRMLPDTVIRMTDVKVFVRSDTGRSKVTAEWEIVGTKLYEYPLKEILPAMSSNECVQVVNRVPPAPMIVHPDTICVESTHSEKVDSVVHHLPMTQPRRVRITGTLTFYLDEEKKIDGVEFKSNTDLATLYTPISY